MQLKIQICRISSLFISFAVIMLKLALAACLSQIAFSQVAFSQVAIAKNQCLGLPAKNNAQVKIIGEAVGENGEFLYCEYHSKIINPQQLNNAQELIKSPELINPQKPIKPQQDNQNINATWLVEYANHKSDKLIAKKHLVYRAFDVFSVAPEVEQTDFRTSELRRSVYSGDNILLSYQENTSKSLESKAIPSNPLPVIDAGFDNFVRVNWQTLVAGEPVVFDFASVPHLRVISLRAIKKPLSDCVAHSDAFICLHVQASNRFLRLFVGELELVYDERKRLKIFKGAVNIQDDNAKSQKAVITYSYKAEL